MYEDAHLEAAYEDRFGFPDDGYGLDDDRYDLEDDFLADEFFECPVHGDVAVTSDEETPSMAGHGTDGTLRLSCGGVVRYGPYQDGAVRHGDA
jgi:hypothetical protein